MCEENWARSRMEGGKSGKEREAWRSSRKHTLSEEMLEKLHTEKQGIVYINSLYCIRMGVYYTEYNCIILIDCFFPGELGKTHTVRLSVLVGPLC